MSDPLARPGRQQGSRSSLPTYSIDVSGSTETSRKTLPGTAGINLATGSVRLFGLESQSTGPADTVTRPADPVNDNVYRVPDPLRFVAGVGETLAQGVLGAAGLPKNTIPKSGSAVADAAESFAAEVSKVPVLSNAVGMAGNLVGLAGQPVATATEIGAAGIGAVGTILTPVFDFAYQKAVTEPRMEDASKVIDLVKNRNMSSRRAYYEQLHGSPFPWDWNTPENKLGWDDYLDWAQKSYDLIGTERPARLEDPISLGGGIGSMYQWMTKLSGMHNARDPRAYGLEYLSNDFTKMYLEGVPTEEILQHFRDNMLLTNTNPINAMVFSIANPVEWIAWDIPVKAVSTAGRIGPKLAGAYRAAGKEGISFSGALARSSMSKESYAVLKHMKSVGKIWDMGEGFVGKAGSVASGIAHRLWSPTTFQAVAEEFGTNRNIRLSGSESGASTIKSYYDMHASIGPDAAESFSDGFIRAVAYDITGETINELASEARITGLSQSEQILGLAAKGDVESLASHPALIGQQSEVINEITSTVQTYMKNPAGQQERELITNLWKKLVLARNEVEIGKNVGAMEVNSKRIKWIFKTFKKKILANARLRLADSKSRYIPKIKTHLSDNMGASGDFVESIVRKHLAAAGKTGDEAAAAKIRMTVQSVWLDAQKRFNDATASGNLAKNADILQELSNHAEIARLAAYGKALEHVTNLRKIPGYANINVISENSLTGPLLAKEVELVTKLIDSGDLEKLKVELKRIAHGYEQTRSQFDSSVVIDELIDETPLELGKNILDSLRRIKEDRLFVSEASATKLALQTIVDGPGAVQGVPENAIGLWDAIPTSTQHAPFEGELDFDKFAKVITADSPQSLLLNKPNDVVANESIIEHLKTKELLFNEAMATQGYDGVRQAYEIGHKGLEAVVSYKGGQAAVDNVAGLRPLRQGASETLYVQNPSTSIDEGTNLTGSEDLAMFNTETGKTDIPLEVIGEFGSGMQSHYDWFTDAETTFSQIGREFAIQADGWHMSGPMGDEKRYLVKTFTENPKGLHSLMVRNRVSRQIAGSSGVDTIWAFPEIRVGTSNRLAAPSAYVEEGSLADYANTYAIQEDRYISAIDEAASSGYVDQSKIHSGAGWLFSSNPSSIHTARAVWGTEAAIQQLSPHATLRLILDPAAVASKFALRAEKWGDGGADFRSVLIHLNKDGDITKATQYLDPNNQLLTSGVYGPDGKGYLESVLTADPNTGFVDWIAGTYMESTVSGTSVKIKDLILKSIDQEGFAKFKELNPGIAANENKALFEYTMLQLGSNADTQNMVSAWLRLPKKIMSSKTIKSGDNGEEFYNTFSGFSHSWADWLHAWDSHRVAAGSWMDDSTLKGNGKTTLFDIIGETDAYTAALWRRLDEISEGGTPDIAYRPGKGPEDLKKAILQYLPENEYGGVAKLSDYDFGQADDVTDLLHAANEVIYHPYIAAEDYSSLEFMRAALHNQAETLGTLVDRSVVSIIDDIWPKGSALPFGSEVSGPALLNASKPGMGSLPHADVDFAKLLQEGQVSAADLKMFDTMPYKMYDVAPRIYTEYGTLLSAPKVVSLREIKNQKILAELDISAHKNKYTYGTQIVEDVSSLRNRLTDIEWVRGDVASALRAQEAAYEKLMEDPNAVQAANIYKAIRDLGYDIGKDPATGMVPEIRYVNSPITREVVPMSIPRPFIAPNKMMSLDTIGMGGPGLMMREGSNMNTMKRLFVEYSNNEVYQNVAQRMWRGSAGKLTENDTYSIVANLFRRAILQDINPQGLTAKEVQEIFVAGLGGGEIGLRKYVKIFGPDTESLLPRSLLLYAAAGDLQKIGVLPHFSKSLQAKNPAMATWANKMHPLARYKYSPYFNQQEAVEPIALLELNGIRGKRTREEASLLTGLLSAPGTARWDNYETGAQVLRPKTTILTDIDSTNPELGVWGILRQNKILGKIAMISAPVGDVPRQAIVGVKASSIQQMAYNNAKIRGGMQRVLNIIPEVQSWMRTKGLNSVDDAFKYMLDAGAWGAMPSRIMPWSDKLSARWTTGTVMDLGPLKPIQDILAKAESGGTLTTDELESMISAKLLAENTGATDELQKDLVEAFSNFMRTVGAKSSDNVKTVSGEWKGLDAMTTREGIDSDIANELSRWTGTGNVSINEYLAAKAEFGVQDTRLAKDVAEMERVAKGATGSYNPSLADPFSPMEERIKRIDKAINSNRIVSSFPLYRGTDLSLFMTPEQIKNLKSGSEFGMENISSWSREGSIGRGFSKGPHPVVLEIVHPVGIPGIDLLAGKAVSGYSREAEVLLPRGLRWRVQAVGEFGSVMRLQVSPILDRKYLMSVKGLGAEPAAIQQLRQAVDNILVQSQTRYETARVAYRLIETYPQIKKELYEKAIAAGATFKKTYNPEDIVMRKPVDWTSHYTMQDPTTGRVSRQVITFPENPGDSFVDPNLAYGTVVNQQITGMNKAEVHIGNDGIKRLMKQPGATAPNATEQALAAINEWVGARVYSKLGLGVPRTSLSVKDGKAILASEWMDNIKIKPLEEWTQDEARKFADGALADLVFGSWDPLGRVETLKSIADNAGVDELGRVVRIDMGSFGLFRAGGNRKEAGDLKAFNPGFWFREKESGSRWPVGQLLAKAWPDSKMITVKPQVITNHPHFLEMADSLTSKLDQAHPEGLRGFLQAMYHEAFKALDGKLATKLTREEVIVLADETADMIETQLVTVREVAALQRAQLDEQIKVYQSWKASKSADASVPKLETTYTPDPTTEYLFERMAYHHANKTMLPIWEEALTKVSAGETLDQGTVNALAKYLPDFLLPRSRMEQLFQAGSMALMEGTKTAVTRQLYATEKTLLERSLNHPYLGIYPLSYQLHKVLPEFFQALFVYAPFVGTYKPFWGAYKLQQVNDYIAAAMETSPEIKQFIESRPPLVLWLNGILPGFPTDISVSFPYVFRTIAGALAEGKPEDVPGNAARAALTSLTRTIGPLQSGQQIYNIAEDVSNFIFQPGGPFGGQGAGPTIQQWLWPGETEPTFDRPE